MTANAIAGPFLVAQQLVWAAVTRLMPSLPQFLTHQLSRCRRRVAEQLLRPPVMRDPGPPAGSLRSQPAGVRHTGRKTALLRKRFGSSSEQQSIRARRWRDATRLERENSNLTQLLPASASEPRRQRAFLRPQEAFPLHRMNSRVPGGTAGPVSATKIGLPWNKYPETNLENCLIQYRWWRLNTNTQY